jgi:hypothetical protein
MERLALFPLLLPACVIVIDDTSTTTEPSPMTSSSSSEPDASSSSASSASSSTSGSMSESSTVDGTAEDVGACERWAETAADCLEYPAYADYAEAYCTAGQAEAEECSAACGAAYETYFACLSELPCEELFLEAACGEQDSARLKACGS